MSCPEPGGSARERGEAGSPELRTGWLDNRKAIILLPNGSRPTLLTGEPNQINNVLAFPGIFRGLLDGGAAELSLAAQCAAARAIADTVPGGKRDAQHIVPDVFDVNLVPAVAHAVMNA